MELTRDKIEWLAKQSCITEHVKVETEELLCIAKQLLREMDKPSVWTDAPEWATKAVVNWSAPTHYSGVYKEYTRELPKTRIDEIAEEVGIEEGKKYGWSPAVIVSAIGIAKAAILKDREDREANQ